MLRITATSRDGRLFPLALATDSIAKIEPEARPDMPSKAVVKLKDGQVYFVTETFEQLMDQL